MRHMGLQGVDARQGGAHDGQRQGSAVPAGPGQPAVPGAAAERAVGLGLHLRRDLAGLRLRGLRHRRVRPAHRRLAGVAHGARRLRARCAGAGAARAPARPRAAASSITAIAGRNTSAIRYTERLAEAGIEPSVGSVGDSYDNALAETINGLYKTEVIHRRGPWRTWRRSSSPPSNGWTGSTTAACSSPSATFRPPRPKHATMLKLEDDRHGGVTQAKPASGKPGAVQIAPVVSPWALGQLVS